MYQYNIQNTSIFACITCLCLIDTLPASVPSTALEIPGKIGEGRLTENREYSHIIRQIHPDVTNVIERYIGGREETWRKGVENIILEIEKMRKEMRREMEIMEEEMEKMYEQMREKRRLREEKRRREKIIRGKDKEARMGE